MTRLNMLQRDVLLVEVFGSLDPTTRSPVIIDIIQAATSNTLFII